MNKIKIAMAELFMAKLCEEKGFSENDLFRMRQCFYCLNNPETCGCSDDDEDENGHCKKYLGVKLRR